MIIFLGDVGSSGIPMYFFPLVYGVGFVAAVVIGSIAWYNSKRPAGWEDVQRPDFIPKVNAETESEDPSSER
jgi:hypothetical protein